MYKKRDENNIAIIIPAMNEGKTIGHVVNELVFSFDCLVIVVDDASVDDTALNAKQAGALVLSHVYNLGAWRATQTGMRYAKKHGFKWVITCDADGQHTVSSIRTLINSHTQADCVVGSCVSRGSTGRHLAWRFFKYLSGLSVSDLTSGLRCYNRKALGVLTSRQATMFDYQDVGVLLMLKKLKMQVHEVDVQMMERQDGISRIFYSWIAVFRYLLYTFVLSMTKVGPHHAGKYHKKLTSKVDSE